MSSDSDARFEAMEKKINDLTSRLDSANCSDSSDKKSKKKKSTEKRAPTAYNKFMQEHIQTAKAKFGDSEGKFDHKKAFSEAAAAWSKSKADKKESSE
jgi:hypothetical protein